MSTEQSPDSQNNPSTPAEDMPPPPPAYQEDSPPPAPTYASPPPSGSSGKDKKMLAGILAIVLGAYGIHKFILGYTKEGIIMCVIGVVGLFLCGIPTIVVAIIGIIEGIMYLTKTDEEFERTYIQGQKPWF